MQVDTIVAVSTAPGPGAVAIVRLSGPDAGRCLLSLAPELSGKLPAPRFATLVSLVSSTDGALLDRALATYFAGPASYTGEDMVELSCHGGRLVPALIEEACVRAGARKADPGEFTRRAYLHGKLDLVQAEAVADLIEARSQALHRASLIHLDRGLSERIAEARRGLVGLEAMLAHAIDFPEEDDAPIPLERIADEAGRVEASLDALLRTAPGGALLRDGAMVVIAGRPNAGKSALYNALLGEDRAIVTEVPGTTRDALVAEVELGGFPFRLVDTAGIREGTDTVERIGIEVTRRYLDRADVVVLCVPAGEGAGEEESRFVADLGAVPVLLVETKADLVEDAGAKKGAAGVIPEDARLKTATKLRTSVVTGEGLGSLGGLLANLVYEGLVVGGGETPVVTRARQREGLAAARAEVEAFRSAVAAGLPAELAATHLGSAASSLEEVLGVITTEDVLDAVFSRFCVGK